MAFITEAFDFIEKLDEQNDVKSLLASFQGFIGRYGFTGFCVGDPSHPKIQRNDRLWATTWPEEWLVRWSTKNYISVDPVIYQLLAHNLPFRWADVRCQADRVSGRVMDEAHDFGMNDGFGVPIYSRDGRVIGVTLGAERYELSKREEACLHLATIYFQARLERLRPSPPSVVVQIKLTPRERECLSWVAAGKSDWEISQILSIAEDTTHEYVQNAMVKLNATTRAQAVALSLIEGVISV